jgi:Fuc2NAc and GlcNAc transferase
VQASVAALVATTLLLSAGLTYAVLRRARASGLVDIPNARSSHRRPTPTGGGIAIVVAATTGLAALALKALLDAHLLAAACGGVIVAAAGLIDDRRRLSPHARLTVHVLAAVWALTLLGGMHVLQLGHSLWMPRAVGYVLGVLGVVWSINLFNFMDGIDGIAAAQAIFMTCAAALLGALAGTGEALVTANLVFGAACAGFVLWNWPPARIFMGDVGSGYIGYMLAVLALAEARSSALALWIWLTLGGVFFVDATVTLARRFLRGERVYEAHRSRAYQTLARRWQSHGRTTGGVTLVNVLWLLPCAWLESRSPQYAAAIAVAALAPLAVAALAVGAGHREVGGSA